MCFSKGLKEGIKPQKTPQLEPSGSNKKKDLSEEDVHLLAQILSVGLVDADPNYLHHLKGYRDLRAAWFNPNTLSRNERHAAVPGFIICDLIETLFSIVFWITTSSSCSPADFSTNKTMHSNQVKHDVGNELGVTSLMCRRGNSGCLTWIPMADLHLRYTCYAI